MVSNMNRPRMTAFANHQHNDDRRMMSALIPNGKVIACYNFDHMGAAA